MWALFKSCPGIDPNFSTPLEQTALSDALSLKPGNSEEAEAQVKVVRLLLDHPRTDSRAMGDIWWKPLELAMKDDSSSLSAFLEIATWPGAVPKEHSPITYAAINGYLPAVKHYVTHAKYGELDLSRRFNRSRRTRMYVT